MRHLAFTLVLVLTAVLPVAAQTSKVTTGVLLYQQQSYAEAIAKLEEGIADPSLLKPKVLAKAQYHLAMSYFRAANDSALSAQFPGAALKAKENLEKALKDPESGAAWTKQATLDNATQGISRTLLNEGLTIFNDGKDQEALQLLQAAANLEPDYFLTQRMLGAAYIQVKDTAKGAASLEEALNVYKKRYVGDAPGIAELKTGLEYKQDSGQVSYVVRQLAVIYNAQKEPRKALAILEEGYKISPKDKEIQLVELSIYQQNPELFSDAVTKFEAAIASNPKDERLKMAFASMLERNNRKEDAIKLYQEVYDQNPNSLEANYGLGASYVNQAAALSEIKMKERNETKIEELDAQILVLLEKAYPFIKKLHELQPTEREWLSQLVSIAGNLNKMDEMEAYGKKLGEMNRP
ncbi:MAG: tetratricopeptide repeat protein [Bacteroidia bacterium]|nr:tetratricopeptide repeat protein [Bacteroidia bacterium]